MARWRRKALELFPERRRMVIESEGAHTLFGDLLGDLQFAYRAIPPDRSFIDRTFDYAAWCFEKKQNRYLRNAAAVSFYEHLPTFRPAREDFIERLTPTVWSELQPLLYQMLEPRDYDPFEAAVRAQLDKRGR